MPARGFSLEATRPSEAELAGLAGSLAPGTRIYLSRVPSQSARELAEAAAKVGRAGYEPVAHIAARRMASATELADFLARVAGEAGMRRVLVIAGDGDAAGPYADALAVIRGGGLRAAGIEEIGISGHPEGHPKILRPTLERAMAEKIAAAADQGLRLHIVTQFSFAPERVVTWLRRLRADGVMVPVRVGMVGPTRLSSLLRYAARCGVKASVGGLALGAAAGLLGHVGPERMLEALRNAGAETGDIAPHYFSFGGLAETARYASTAGLHSGQRAIKLIN